MTEKLIVYTPEELASYKKRIVDNMIKSIQAMQQVMEENNVLSIFKSLKFDKIAVEPLSGKCENIIEVINQSQTYIVSIMAVEKLFELHSEQTYIINWGNIPGYDIESVDGTIIAECFAATSYKSNAKLTADLKRLHNNKSAKYKYEFFYDKEFTESHKMYYKKKYPDVEIFKFTDISKL